MCIRDRLYGIEALYDGGLAVRTTLNPRLQKAAGNALRKWLVAYDQRHGWRGSIANIDLGEDWVESFKTAKKTFLNDRKIAEDLSPWKAAVVLGATATDASIGFDDGTQGTIPLEQMEWARSYKTVNEVAEKMSAVSQVLSRGDICLLYTSPSPRDS